MVNSVSPHSDLETSNSYSSSQELVRDLTQKLELRRRDSDDGQALASTSNSSYPSKLELELKSLLLVHGPKRKRNTNESVRVQMAPATTSESSRCSAHVSVVPKTKRKAMGGTIVKEIRSDKPPQTSTATQGPVVVNGAAASPSAGCPTTTVTATTGEKPKRKRIRKSKKPPTTTVYADPSEFLAKVQELTGQKPPLSNTISESPYQHGELCAQLRLVRPEPKRHNASTSQPMDLDFRDITARVPSELGQEHSLPPIQDQSEQVDVVEHKPTIMHATTATTTEEPESFLNYTMGYSGSLDMEPFLLDSEDADEPRFMVSEETDDEDYSHKLFHEESHDEDFMKFLALSGDASGGFT